VKAFKQFGTAVAATAILGAILGGTLAGCSSGQIGVRPDVGQQAFEVGKTTRMDVMNTIGLPQRVEKDDAGNDHYFYERSARLTGLCIACGMPGNTTGIIPAAAVQGSKEKALRNAVELVFDTNGMLITAQ
jgi:hypothetical protein